MRVAVVDIGTNSTRLLIADVEDGRVVAEPERRSNVTRLGQGVDASGALAPEAEARVFAVLDEYRVLIRRHKCDAAIAVLTSAVRDASNGAEFTETVGGCYGLEARTLSGDQEAQLTFRGATSERDPADDTPLVVIDIGGGSTELVTGAHGDMASHVSTQAGVVRQTERHLHSDPPTEEELSALSDEVRGIVEDAVSPETRESVRAGVAVAGTATQAAAIAQELEPYDPEKVHGYVLTREALQELLDRLASLALEERIDQVKGLDPKRAPTIVAGVAILLQVMEVFELTNVEVSEHDILRGAALERASRE
jgi:exopolyphosphatase / guanosine-5'-triphosphate,3'-diphosphate pyrophosphatase